MADTPQAFPCLDSSGYGLSMRDPGMTLRDWFAGQALPSVMHLCAKDTLAPGQSLLQSFAGKAYDIADAMLAARTTKPGEVQ